MQSVQQGSDRQQLAAGLVPSIPLPLHRAAGTRAAGLAAQARV